MQGKPCFLFRARGLQEVGHAVVSTGRGELSLRSTD